jgi:hypothetical protein
MLGASQAGLAARYRAGRGLAVAARVSSPAEAALGIEWTPSRRLPLRLLAERRQRLGREGRSAFALLVHGGVSDFRLPAQLRLDAYAQAGIVGARSRDAFADGALRLSLPAGRLKLGAGAWAAAQPGVSRLDLGPQASLRLGPGFTLAGDYRWRVGGNTAPTSGPSFTLFADF